MFCLPYICTYIYICIYIHTIYYEYICPSILFFDRRRWVQYLRNFYPYHRLARHMNISYHLGTRSDKSMSLKRYISV